MKSEVLVPLSPAVYMAKRGNENTDVKQPALKSLLLFIVLGIYVFGSRVNNQRYWIYYLFCNKLLYHLLL